MQRSAIVYMICLCFFIIQARAQIISDQLVDNSTSINISREINISFFVGLSAFGTQNDLEYLLSKSNWNHTIPSGCFFFFCTDPKDYPYTKKLAVFNFEGTYFFTEQMGASLNIGISDNIESTGYKGTAGTLHINSTVSSVSANFVFRPKGKRHTFVIGPTLLSHAITGEQITPSSKQLKLGAYLGWTVNLVQKPKFSLPFKIVYRWSSQYDVGPFDVTPNNPGLAVLPLQVVSINASSLNIGLAFTFRFDAQDVYSK